MKLSDLKKSKQNFIKCFCCRGFCNTIIVNHFVYFSFKYNQGRIKIFGKGSQIKLVIKYDNRRDRRNSQTYFVMEILSCALCVYYVLVIIFYIISIDTFTYNHSYMQNKLVFPTKIKDVLQLKLF